MEFLFKLDYIIDHICEIIQNTFIILAINIEQRCQALHKQITCFKHFPSYLHWIIATQLYPGNQGYFCQYDNTFHWFFTS